MTPLQVGVVLLMLRVVHIAQDKGVLFVESWRSWIGHPGLPTGTNDERAVHAHLDMLGCAFNEFAGDNTTAVAEIPGGYASAPAFSQQQAAESTKGLQASPENSGGWRGTRFYPGWADVQKALPGLLLVVMPIALLSEVIWLIEIHLHATFFVDIFIAGVLALIAANIFTLPEWVQGGFTFSTRWFLRLGIICYALKFSYQPLLQTGLPNLVIVTSTVATALGVSVLGGKLLKLNPRIAVLIGVGTGICGISATIVTSPAIGARDEDTAVTLGTILCWGTTGLLLYPLVNGLFHLSPVVYGAWTGATIHDLPQLIAAAQQGGGSAALKAALFVKLVRVAFIVVLVFFLSKRALARRIPLAQRHGVR